MSLKMKKVKWMSIIDEMQGSVDKKHYARHIPGNGEWAAVCNKPELSKKTKKVTHGNIREHETAKRNIIVVGGRL